MQGTENVNSVHDKSLLFKVALYKFGNLETFMIDIYYYKQLMEEHFATWAVLFCTASNLLIVSGKWI